MPIAIPWHRRLEARVLAGVIAIVGVSLTALTLVTSGVVSRQAISHSEQDLRAAHTALTNMIATQTELAGTQTRFVTGLPVFRAHMTDSQLASDVATMEAMAEMYRADLSASFSIVSDRSGRWLASPGLPPDGAYEPLVKLVAATVKGTGQREIAALGGQLYLIVTEPALFADEVLGTLTTGYALDDMRARELARATGRAVVLVAGKGISGASLDDAARTKLAAMLRRGENPFASADPSAATALGSEEFVGATFALSENAPGAPAARVILLDSWTPTATFIADVRWRMLWTGALVFALGIAASLFMSRHMSRPLRDLAEVAGAVAKGQWEQRLTATGSAEAHAMAEAFNDMTASLSHWHAEAKQRAEQLQSSYERYYAVTQSVHDAIVSTDAQGAIIFWHPRAEALFGLSESAALGRPFSSLLAPACQERYLAAVDGLTRDGDNGARALTFDGEGVRADNATFPLELSLAAWTSGAQTCFTAVVRDVTERRRAEEELRLRDQQLREAQKMDAIGRLASGIAHDFNNSLMVIQGHAEMLLLNTPDTDPRRKKVDVIIQSSIGAAAITRRLLTFGRKQTNDVRVVDPREHVTSAQKVLGRLLGDDIKVIATAETTPGNIRIDPDQLDQVIMNLAINARDAMPGGGELRLHVRGTTLADAAACRRIGLAPGNYVTIAISDTGCGMDEATAARIFEPFFTTKDPGKGTGLGLAIVQGIVTQGKGRVVVETAPGRGTTFLLHFPAVDGTIEPPRAAAPQAIAHGSETILIAEDKPLVRRILKTALESAGYSVLEAANGDEALEVARRHDGRIDLLLTDVVMPGRPGYALYEALTAEYPGTQVIFMSGHPAGADARDAVDRSGLPCLQKPFSFEVLSTTLRTVLDAAQAA
jgi:PAS domain S-box-containing protein